MSCRESLWLWGYMAFCPLPSEAQQGRSFAMWVIGIHTRRQFLKDISDRLSNSLFTHCVTYKADYISDTLDPCKRFMNSLPNGMNNIQTESYLRCIRLARSWFESKSIYNYSKSMKLGVLAIKQRVFFLFTKPKQYTLLNMLTMLNE